MEEPNAEIRRILSLPQLELPYRFAGGATVAGLALDCSKCGAEISDLRGIWTAHNVHSAALEAYGICWKDGCQMIQPVNGRFAEDGSCLLKGPDGWHSSSYTVEPGWFGRLKTIIKLHLGGTSS